MPSYRERLWPAPWMFVAVALVIPASLLVFLPINFVAGVVVALVLYAGCIGVLLAASPTISVVDGVFRAGKASIPIELIGETSVYRREDATWQRGPGLDARAWLLLRGWVDPVVRLTIDDNNDPTPYWLVSSRHPEELARVVREVRSTSS
ncbi:DUF3093 domain-containing protein [Antiquaquibacter oligotrophicus]|nr:DUF3093 domain-containing protein [Antiquaquibacter oligotrophicus]UDF13267.1 DUF3093 domain-containing protein [Antiquaquibacter oligotrophicus]